MAKTNNEGVIKAFFYGKKGAESHTGSLWTTTDGKRLMNYATCLAERSELGLLVNLTRYSNTTNKIQAYFQRELRNQYSSDFINEHVIELDNVRIETAYLENDAKKLIEWSKGIQPLQLINYFDVWGNKKDGWEINNLCNDGEIYLHETELYDYKKIVQQLKEIGFLKSTVRMNQLFFEDLTDFGIEIYQKKDMMPVCRLEFMRTNVEVN